jgi:dGTPase
MRGRWMAPSSLFPVADQMAHQLDGAPDDAVPDHQDAGRGDARYGDHDRARWLPELPKVSSRSEFERDRGRVLHSAALRRLSGKTQILVAGESDFPRNRLTHSLEVAQIGRELGRVLGCDPDVVEVACLAHDLGHPPFGHNGERALDEIAAPCGGFEGNAQTLRILTRLEAKSFAPGPGHTTAGPGESGRSIGLNLTRASLDATTKYPWSRSNGPPGSNEPRATAGVKYGVYADDMDVFTWLRAGAPTRVRCVEAQVMDWADDVAYSVHDVEDAVQAGHVQLAQLDSPADRAEVLGLAVSEYLDAGRRIDVAECDAALGRLQAEPWWVSRFDGSLRSLAALKSMASELIGRFCRAAEDATRARWGPGQLVRYDASLEIPRQALVECAALKAVAAVFVMKRASVQAGYAQQRELVTELTSALLETAPDHLGSDFAAAYEAAADEPERLRVVVDRVAGLTDASATLLHSQLVGPGLS